MKKKLLLILCTFLVIIIGTRHARAEIYLNYNELNIGIDVSMQLKVSGNITGNLSWSNSNNNVVSLNNSYVTGLSLGTSYITVNSDIYSSSCKVNVISNYIPVNNISLPSNSGEVLLSQTKNINASIKPDNASNKQLFYSSSNQEIATVDSNGNVTGHKLGSCYITIAAENKSTTYKVNVVDKILLTSIGISPTTLSMTEGETKKLNVSFNPENATDKSVSWKSSNTSIVTVDGEGNIKAISAGNANITVTSNDGSHTATSKITVNPLDKSLKGISLNKNEVTLKVGDSETISVNYKPSYANNKKVEWSSSNKEIATVENGKIVALKPGKTDITVKSDEGNYVAICKVTVLSPPIESIKFENEQQTVYVGSVTTLNTISTPQDTMINDPVWTSSDETVATINNGELTALKVGNTIITISDKEGKVSAKAEITVVEKPEEALMITVSGYNLNFDPNIKNYTLLIGNETSLDIKVNREDKKVSIGGNRDLQNGSIITVTISDKQKTTYVINISKKQNNYLYFIVIITILLLINIIRILIKNRKKRN